MVDLSSQLALVAFFDRVPQKGEEQGMLATLKKIKEAGANLNASISPDDYMAYCDKKASRGKSWLETAIYSDSSADLVKSVMEGMKKNKCKEILTDMIESRSYVVFEREETFLGFAKEAGMGKAEVSSILLRCGFDRCDPISIKQAVKLGEDLNESSNMEALKNLIQAAKTSKTEEDFRKKNALERFLKTGLKEIEALLSEENKAILTACVEERKPRSKGMKK